MVPATLDRIKCPNNDVLHKLLDPSATGTEPSSEVVAHVGECNDCREKLEKLAVGQNPYFPAAVLHADQVEPPRDSAYWNALGKAEKALTVAHSEDASPVDLSDLKLDFLSATSTPGRLGKLGSFDIKRVIGRGGMGVVLQGFDASLHRDVAIKVLDPQLAGNDTARQRFCREARAAAAVAHDNLVGVYQVNEDANSGLPYLVMQLVVGESLEQRLRRVGKLSVLEAVRIGMQSAAGLAGAHATGLIHRDIKPGNILIESGTEKAKLTDFGLARAAEDMKLTRTGFVAGTPLYMAPEQARGDDIDARADLFSLGSVLYESLAGKPPFEGRTPLAVLKRVEGEAHVPLRELNPDVPEWLEDSIDRLLAKDPIDRFQTAAELAEYFAFKFTLLKGSSPAVEATECATAKGSSRSLLRGKGGKKFCGRTAGMLLSVFGVGFLIGVGAMALFAPPMMMTTVERIVNVPGETITVAGPPGKVDVGPEPLALLESMSGAVMAVSLSPDGTTTAVGAENGTIYLWSSSSKKIELELHQDKDGKLSAHSGPVWSVNFDAEGKRLISVGDEGHVKSWDVKTGKLLSDLALGFSIRTATINPSGNYVAVGDREGKVRVMDLQSENPVLEYEQGSTVNAIAFHPDGLMLASAGTDGNVIVWNVAGKQKRFVRQAHNSPIYSIAFSPDGDQFATAGWDQTVQRWNINGGTRIGKPLPHEDGVWAVTYSPCGKIIATAGQDGKTRIWSAELDEPKLLKAYSRHKGPIHALSFGVGGKVLLTGGRDGNVRLWDSQCGN